TPPPRVWVRHRGLARQPATVDHLSQLRRDDRGPRDDRGDPRQGYRGRRMTDSAAGAMPTVKMDLKMVASRYSLVAQFLCSSAQFARRCVDIERIINPDELLQTEHLGLVTAAIMQSVAAVEANSAEVITHGPGSHLGLSADTEETRAFLAPLDEFIDNRREPLKRYKLILHLLRKPPLIEGEQPWQNMQALVRLRNALTHHTSKWREEVEENSPFQILRNCPGRSTDIAVDWPRTGVSQGVDDTARGHRHPGRRRSGFGRVSGACRRIAGAERRIGGACGGTRTPAWAEQRQQRQAPIQRRSEEEAGPCQQPS